MNLGVAAILVMLVSASSSAGPVLADFSDPAEIDQWTGVHDRVMGGVSEAVLVHVGDRAVFSGTVSTDFGGGFASVRRKPADLALDGEAGVRIRVRGDGKQYQMRLKPGDRVVDAGCGWGALALHMARHYGASVRAFNISHEQIAFARERARVEGLDDHVEFIEDDYRNIRGQRYGFELV